MFAWVLMINRADLVEFVKSPNKLENTFIRANICLRPNAYYYYYNKYY